ncbi:MAG TPA: hypothetical protein VHO47_00350 [Candidatus Babeliales bacterium]|nr:hypothetical protein [Candidatus Babeliales bacterium]
MNQKFLLLGMLVFGCDSFIKPFLYAGQYLDGASSFGDRSCVDSFMAADLIVKKPAMQISISNVSIYGLSTINGIIPGVNDRILLIGQTNQVENGLWLAQLGSWIRPLDFNAGAQAGRSHIKIIVTTDDSSTDSEWVCTSPNSLIGTDPITFAPCNYSDQLTGANIGTGTGQFFRDKTGNTLNFKTIAVGAHLALTNNTNDVLFSTDATTINSANTLVARDASGNFSAGTINANLVGNVTGNVIGNAATATSAASATNFTGALSGNVTGTQAATVVAFVGGQTASAIAAGAVAANSATNSNTANTIVKRDASGNFNAGTINANLTGAASLNVLKAGDTMIGSLKFPSGSPSAPALSFSASTQTGLALGIDNSLSLGTTGTERMRVGTSIFANMPLILKGVLNIQAIQSITPTNNGSVITASTTGLLLLKHTSNVTNFTVNFPPNPVNGQLFTILLGTSNTISLNNAGGAGGASVINAITSLNPGSALAAATNGTSVTYFYSSAANSWYRFLRG